MNAINLKGGRELMAFLDALPAKIEKNVLRGALRAGAKVIQQEARANVSAKSGLTRKAIKIDTVTDGGQIKARVKLRGKHSYLGWWLEHGVGAHLIISGDSDVSTRALNKRAKKSGVLKDAGNGLIRVGGYEYMTGPRGQRTDDDAMKINDKFIRGAVMHPGFAPKPFMRPALDTKAKEAVQAVGDYMKHRLQIGSLNAPALEVDDE